MCYRGFLPPRPDIFIFWHRQNFVEKVVVHYFQNFPDWLLLRIWSINPLRHANINGWSINLVTNKRHLEHAAANKQLGRSNKTPCTHRVARTSSLQLNSPPPVSTQISLPKTNAIGRNKSKRKLIVFGINEIGKAIRTELMIWSMSKGSRAVELLMILWSRQFLVLK